MRVFSAVVLVLSIFFIISCSATLPYQFENREYLVGQNNGILICSVREVKYGMLTYPSSSYYLRKTGENEEIRIIMDGLPVSKEEIENGIDCEVIIYELPAGHYELFRWDLFFNMGLIQYHKRPMNEFSIPFEIRPDSINYIGELAVENYILRIVDKGERDYRISIEHEPSISQLTVVKHEIYCQSGCSNEIQTTDEFFYVPIIPVQ